MEHAFGSSFDAANHVLNDAVLQKVARIVWEKELMKKYRNKYVIRWAIEPTSFLNGIVVEKREDDALVSPKSNDTAVDPRVTRFKYFKYNEDTLYKRPQEDWEPNEAVSYHFN